MLLDHVIVRYHEIFVVDPVKLLLHSVDFLLSVFLRGYLLVKFLELSGPLCLQLFTLLLGLLELVLVPGSRARLWTLVYVRSLMQQLIFIAPS